MLDNHALVDMSDGRQGREEGREDDSRLGYYQMLRMFGSLAARD